MSTISPISEGYDLKCSSLSPSCFIPHEEICSFNAILSSLFREQSFTPPLSYFPCLISALTGNSPPLELSQTPLQSISFSSILPHQIQSFPLGLWIFSPTPHLNLRLSSPRFLHFRYTCLVQLNFPSEKRNSFKQLARVIHFLINSIRSFQNLSKLLFFFSLFQPLVVNTLSLLAPSYTYSVHAPLSPSVLILGVLPIFCPRALLWAAQIGTLNTSHMNPGNPAPLRTRPSHTGKTTSAMLSSSLRSIKVQPLF